MGEQSPSAENGFPEIYCLACNTKGKGRYCWNCGESLKTEKALYPKALKAQYEERAFVEIRDPSMMQEDSFLADISDNFNAFLNEADIALIRTTDLAFARLSQMVFVINGDGKTNEEMRAFMEAFSTHAESTRDKWVRNGQDLMTTAIYFIFNEGAPDHFFDEVNTQRRPLNPLNPKNWAELNRRRKNLKQIADTTFYPQSMGIDLKTGEVAGLCLELTKEEISSRLSNFADRMPAKPPKRAWVLFLEELFGDQFNDELAKLGFLKEQLRMVYSATLLSYLIKTRQLTPLKFIVFFGAFVTLSQFLASFTEQYVGPINKVLTITDYEIVNIALAMLPLSLMGILNYFVFRTCGGTANIQQSLMASWMSGVILVPAIQITAFLTADSRLGITETIIVATWTFSILYLGPLFKRLHEVSLLKATTITAVIYCLTVWLLTTMAGSIWPQIH